MHRTSLMFTSLPTTPHLPLNPPPACRLRRLDRGGAAHALGLNRLFLLFLMPVQVRAALSSGSNSGAATLPPHHPHITACCPSRLSQMMARPRARCSPAWLTPKWRLSSGRGRFVHALLHLLPILPNFGARLTTSARGSQSRRLRGGALHLTSQPHSRCLILP